MGCVITSCNIFQVKNEGDDFGWGVVVNFSKKSNVKVKYIFTPL